MIRIEGTATEARGMEDIIKKGTIYKSIGFGTRLKHLGLNSDGIQGIDTSRYTPHVYLVFGSASDIKQSWGNLSEQDKSLVLWLTGKDIQINFTYDYRDSSCCVTVSADNWKRLTRILPELNRMVKTIEPNRCELVAA